MIISIGAEKAFDNIHTFHDKNAQQTKDKGLNPMKHLWKTHNWHHSYWWKAGCFSLIIRNKRRVSTLVTAIQPCPALALPPGGCMVFVSQSRLDSRERLVGPDPKYVTSRGKSRASLTRATNQEKGSKKYPYQKCKSETIFVDNMILYIENA